MNKHLYRIVFNQARGALMAVAETVAAHQRGNPGAPGARSAVSAFVLRATTACVAAALGIFHLTAHAQIVADPNAGAHRPTIDQAANGTPIVQITAPSAAGVSRNQFQQFNTDARGAILNNAQTLTPTQLAGYVAGNPNLAGGPARIILNEVTGNQASSLRGYLEVAGQRAQVVVANPNGLVCDGCGAINASRFTLSTGTPVMGTGGSLDAYRVTGGAIAVQGSGMNAANLDQVDLIARSVQINAQLWANSANVVAGANLVNHADLGVQAMTGDANQPTVAIDVSNLGGLYAGKIRLIGTEAGVGVNSAGTIAAQSGALSIDSAGRVALAGTTNAAAGLHIRSAQDVVNSGTVYGKQDVTVQAGGALENTGTVAAQGNVAVVGQRVQSSGTLAAGVDADGAAAGIGNLDITAQGTAALTGHQLATGNLQASGTQLNLAGASSQANGHLVLTATQGEIDHTGAQTQAGAAATLNAAGTVRNDGATLAAQQLSIAANALSNRGGTLSQSGTGATRLNVTHTLDNTNGRIQTAGANTTLAAGSIVNAGGTIAHAGTGALGVQTGALDNSGGKLQTNGALDLQAATLVNRAGVVSAAGHATVHTTGALDNTRGTIAADSLDVAADGALTNDAGLVDASTGATVSANTVSNTGGTIQNAGTQALSVRATQALSNTNSGLIAGNGNVNIAAGAVDNSGGTVSAGGALHVQSDGALANLGGVLAATTALHAQAVGALDNTAGRIEANGATSTLAVSAASLNNTGGRIANAGKGATTIGGGSQITNSNAAGVAGMGMLGGNGDVSITAQRLDNAAGAQVLAGQALDLHIRQALNNTGGTLSATTGLTLEEEDVALSNAGGTISASGDIKLNVARLDNTNGQIGNTANSSANVQANTSGTLSNQGGRIVSDADLLIRAQSLTGSGRIVAGQDATLALQGDYTNAAGNLIQGNRDLTLTTTGTLTNLGGLQAVRNLNASAAHLHNTGLFNAGSTSLEVGGTLTNSGRIEGDTVTTRSDVLTNTGTVLGNTVGVFARQISNDGAGGLLAAVDTLGVYAQQTLSNTNGATLYSLGDVYLAADDTRDASGWLVNKTQSIINEGATIQADENLEIAAAELQNRRADVQFGQAQVSQDEEVRKKRDAYWFCVNGYGYAIGRGCGAAYRTTTATFSTTRDTTIARPTLGEYDQGADGQRVGKTYGPVRSVDAQAKTITFADDTVLHYESLSQNGNDYTVTYYDGGYDPNVHINPLDERPYYVPWSDHVHVEVERHTTTTVAEDRLLSASPEARLLSGNTMRFTDGVQLTNAYSTIAAGGDMVFGAEVESGEVDAGQRGTSTITNIGRTLTRTTTVDEWSLYRHDDDFNETSKLAQPTQVVTEVVGALGGTISAGKRLSGYVGEVVNQDVAADQSAVGGAGSTVGANAGTTTPGAGPRLTVGTPGNPLPGLTLPTSGMFNVGVVPGRGYLVETDPRFTNRGLFLSSDYMLSRLGIDPARTQMRLGDGFYEQKLVSDQVTQLTGRRYLQGYENNEAQFKALMEAGAEVASAFSLVPGLALSAEQMAALTTDIVWMVEQTVTLPDGSTTQALAPVVYLAQSRAEALTPSGAIITADQIDLRASGDITNSGRIAGGERVSLAANNITNRGGSIDSQGTTVVSANTDVVNASGSISGKAVGVSAGRDIRNVTLVDVDGVKATAGASTATNTLVGKAGVIASTGDLAMAAGRDVQVSGGLVAADGNASIVAGRDVLVESVQASASTGYYYDAQTQAQPKTQVNLASGIVTGGDLSMAAGRDMTLTAAQVGAGGDLTAIAQGALTVQHATDSASMDYTNTRDANHQHTASRYDEAVVGSNLGAGGNVTLAGGDVAITGSSLSAGAGGVTLLAERNVTIAEAREQHSEARSDLDARKGALDGKSVRSESSSNANLGVGSTLSGSTVRVAAGNDLTVRGSTVAGVGDVMLAAGNNLSIGAATETSSSSTFREEKQTGFGANGGVGFGKREQKDTARDTNTTQVGSTVGSLAGNLTMTAGNDLKIIGSDLVAGNNLTGVGKTVTIEAAQNQSTHHETHEVKTSGLSIGIAGGLGGALVSGGQAMRDAAASGDARVTALHGMAAGRTLYDAVNGLPPTLPTTKLESAQSLSSLGSLSVSFGSSSSKSTLDSQATQAQGSSIRAGNQASFVATEGNLTVTGSDITARDVLLSAKQDVILQAATDTDSSRNDSKSSGFNVGVTIGANTGVSASGYRAKGYGNSDGTTQRNTHIDASNSATIVSGGNTVLDGATVKAHQIVADIGQDLLIASRQDTANQTQKQQSLSGGIGYGTGGASGSFNYQNSRGVGEFASVVEQSGMFAGDGGFDIRVEGNTHLKGGVIASTATPDKNRLDTGTISWEDIASHSEYSATTVGIGAGLPSMPIHASGDDSSTTRSAVAEGTINIRDQANQGQDVADMSRDTENTNRVVDRNPDMNEVIGKQIALQNAVNAAAPAVARTIGDVAQAQYDAAKQRYQQAYAAGDTEALTQAKADMDNWGSDGKYRAAAQAVGMGVVAALGGGSIAGAMAGAAGSTLLSNEIGRLADQLAAATGLPPGEAQQVASNLIQNLGAAGLGVLIGGGAGGMAGGTVDRYNRQLHTDEQALARRIAEGSGGVYSEQQVADALRLANNKALGENAGANVVVDVSKNPGGYYDGAYMTTPDGQTFVQNTGAIAKPSGDLMAYISNATGGNYSWDAVPQGKPLGSGPVFSNDNPLQGGGCVTIECLAGIDPANKYAVPPTREQVADAVDKGATALALASIWAPPPFNVGAAALAGAFKTTNYLLSPPSNGAIWFDGATTIIPVMLPQGNVAQTTFLFGSTLLQPSITRSIDSKQNQPTCTPPKKC